MFEDSASAADLYGRVLSHDFGHTSAAEAGYERIEAIKALDTVIRSAQAVQAQQIRELHDDRIKLTGLGAGDPTLSIIGEISLARHIGPTAAGTQVGYAIALAELPQTAALFAAGVISEATVRAVTTETAGLSVDDLPLADDEWAKKLPGLTTAEARRAAARIVIAIDAEAARVRAQRDRADQSVTLHPEPNGVATLIARGPAEQLVAAHQALDDLASGLRATGDPRTRGQIMVQTLAERALGVSYTDEVTVEINLVMDAKTLMGEGDTPVELEGYGPIAPDVADDIIARARTVMVRRLFVDPIDGTLVLRESRRRRFEKPSRFHIRTRDRRCRQPGCDAKIRDCDHIEDFQDGGATSVINGQGLCERSHTFKHLPGWRVTGSGKKTIWTTPTGHTYISRPPPVLDRNKPR